MYSQLLSGVAMAIIEQAAPSLATADVLMETPTILPH
jgi:hypothetical protein